MVGAACDGGTAAIAGDARGRPHHRLRPRDGAIRAAQAVAAAGAGRMNWPGRVPLGVVLGTGLGCLAERLEDFWTMSFHDTGWLVSSTATGHAGRIVVGRIACRGEGCWVAALQGRVHGYEGHGPELLTRGVELLAALGATTLVATNAAGGLRPDMRVGELVVISDHIDIVRRHWAGALEEPPAGDSRLGVDEGIEGPAATGFYDTALVDRALGAVRRAGAIARPGVYAHCLGPSYETRAEYRMLRRIGADVVGMSTVPEVVVAGRLGLRMAAVSVVTNVACPDAAGRTDAEDVCHAAAGAADGVWAVLQAIAADCGGRHEGANTGNAGDDGR